MKNQKQRKEIVKVVKSSAATLRYNTQPNGDTGCLIAYKKSLQETNALLLERLLKELTKLPPEKLNLKLKLMLKV